MRCVKGQFHHDVGAFARAALDDGVSPKDLGPLLDSLQAEMTFPHSVHLETHAPVLHLDAKLVVVLGYPTPTSSKEAVALERTPLPRKILRRIKCVGRNTQIGKPTIRHPR